MGQFNGLALLFGAMLLTRSGGDMGRAVVSTLLGHHVVKMGCQISGRVSLKEVVELDGVVCSDCVRYTTDDRDT
jgi:hypothetical protein